MSDNRTGPGQYVQEVARFFMSDEENIQNDYNASTTVQNQVHTSTVRKRIENEHQLIIFGATLMIVAAIVFIAKNRETAKRKRRRANKYAKEMKHQKRYLSRRLANISPFNSIHESLNRRTSTSLDNGKSVIILDLKRKPERKTRAVSTKMGKIGKEQPLPANNTN